MIEQHGTAGAVATGIEKQSMLGDATGNIFANTQGIYDATGSLRLLIEKLHGPRPETDNLSKISPDAPSDIGRLHLAIESGSNAVNELHQVIEDLRNTLGY